MGLAFTIGQGQARPLATGMWGMSECIVSSKEVVMSVMTARHSAVMCALALAIPAAGAQADETFSVDVVADCNRFISEGVGHPHSFSPQPSPPSQFAANVPPS
jgi:hypothetical protein